MYAIVEIAGQQFKAEKGRKLYVHRLAQPEGSSMSCRQVMLIEKDGKVRVGAPIIEDAAVEVEVLRHLKDDKVLIFKKNRRKGYRVKNGHRQCLTQILVQDIVEGKAPEVHSAPVVKAAKVVAAQASPEVAQVAEVKASQAAPKAAAKPAENKTTTTASAKKPAAAKTKKTE